MSRTSASRRGARVSGRSSGACSAGSRQSSALLGRLLAPIGLDLALESEGQRVATPVERLAHGYADPAFADAVFLDIGLLRPVEADAHATLEQGLVVVRAARVNREAVGKRVGHAAALIPRAA